MFTDTDATPAAADTVDLDALRVKALAAFLSLDADEAEAISASRYDDTELEYGRESYRVLTDEEATAAAIAAASDSLWAFNVTFLERYVPALRDTRAADAWRTVVDKLSESAGPLGEALLGDRVDDALRDAVAEDGRGHFLASYDGEENEVRAGGITFYIYRTN